MHPKQQILLSRNSSPHNFGLTLWWIRKVCNCIGILKLRMHCAQYFLFSAYAFSRKLMYRFDNCRPAIVLLCCLDRKNNFDFLHFFITFHLHYFIIALYQKYTALIFHLRGATTKLYGRYPRKLPIHFAGEIIITYLMAFWRNLWPTSTLLISNWWYV